MKNFKSKFLRKDFNKRLDHLTWMRDSKLNRNEWFIHGRADKLLDVYYIRIKGVDGVEEFLTLSHEKYLEWNQLLSVVPFKK